VVEGSGRGGRGREGARTGSEIVRFRDRWVRAAEEEVETEEEEEDEGTNKAECFDIAEEEVEEGFGRVTLSISSQCFSLLEP
jgi:hypothetical protein